MAQLVNRLTISLYITSIYRYVFPVQSPVAAPKFLICIRFMRETIALDLNLFLCTKVLFSIKISI